MFDLRIYKMYRRILFVVMFMIYLNIILWVLRVSLVKILEEICGGVLGGLGLLMIMVVEYVVFIDIIVDIFNL